MPTPPLRPGAHRDGHAVHRRRRPRPRPAPPRSRRDLVDQGNDGLVVSGTTGESPTTTRRREGRPAAGRRRRRGRPRATWSRASAPTTPGHSVELAPARPRRPARTGLLVVTPYYNRPPQAGLLAHFRAVADATDLPVMLYDIPGPHRRRARAPRRCSRSPSTRGSSPSRTPRTTSCRRAAGAGRADLAYYSGDDALNLPLLAVGAVGVVSVTSHVVADRHRATGRGATTPATSPAPGRSTSAPLPVYAGIMSAPRARSWSRPRSPCSGRSGRPGPPPAGRRHRRSSSPCSRADLAAGGVAVA